MQAVILAGGKGRRLRPYTTVFPKPLVPLGEKPILEILIRQLAQHGFDDIVLAVGYLAELIRAYFGDGEKLGVRIRYVKEEHPLGTAGPLRLMVSDLEPHFLCINGDVLTDLNFGHLMQSHLNHGGGATVSLYKRTVKVDFGVVQLDERRMLASWEEKPVIHYLVSMGAYVLARESLGLIPEEGAFDMPDLLMRIAKYGKGVGSVEHDGYWLDIGRPDDYEKANDPQTLEKLIGQID